MFVDCGVKSTTKIHTYSYDMCVITTFELISNFIHILSGVEFTLFRHNFCYSLESQAIRTVTIDTVEIALAHRLMQFYDYLCHSYDDKTRRQLISFSSIQVAGNTIQSYNTE